MIGIIDFEHSERRLDILGACTRHVPRVIPQTIGAMYFMPFQVYISEGESCLGLKRSLTRLRISTIKKEYGISIRRFLEGSYSKELDCVESQMTFKI